MSKHRRPPRKVDEIMASLTHPATMVAVSKPYVFVEGPDDVVIYREIATRIGLSTNFPSFEGVGGRSVIFILHDKIQAQKARIKAQVLFFADRDTSVFAPYFAEFEDETTRYPQINFTKGYSIENDLFEDGQKLLIERLYQLEKQRLESLIESICDWFAFQMELHRTGNSAAALIDISILSHETIEPRGATLSLVFLEKYNYSRATPIMVATVKDNYLLMLRGKYLFPLLCGIINERNGEEMIRHIKEKHLWDDAIIIGLQTEGSNCRRIAAVFQNVL